MRNSKYYFLVCDDGDDDVQSSMKLKASRVPKAVTLRGRPHLTN